MTSSGSERLATLPALAQTKGLYNVVIDTPRGSNNKYSYAKDLAVFRLTKVLPLGFAFPYDFGFIPSTLGADGDALDVLVLTQSPLQLGILVEVKLIGVIEGKQMEKRETIRNDRLLGVIQTEANAPRHKHISTIASSQLDEIEHFFVAYNEIAGKTFKPLRRAGPRAAHALVQQGMNAFAKG